MDEEGQYFDAKNHNGGQDCRVEKVAWKAKEQKNYRKNWNCKEQQICYTPSSSGWPLAALFLAAITADFAEKPVQFWGSTQVARQGYEEVGKETWIRNRILFMKQRPRQAKGCVTGSVVVQFLLFVSKEEVREWVPERGSQAQDQAGH